MTLGFGWVQGICFDVCLGLGTRFRAFVLGTVSVRVRALHW